MMRATITIYEQSTAYDDYFDGGDSGAHSGHENDESYEVCVLEITAPTGARLNDHILAELEYHGLAEWDGGEVAYDPDGAHMGADLAGTITSSYAVIKVTS